MFYFINFFINVAQAQEAVGQQASKGPGWMGLVPFALMFLVFYFLILRPQARKAKEAKDFLKSLKKGDQVLTAGGIFGTIVGVGERFVDLKVSEDTRFKVMKSHIMSSAAEDTGK